MAETLDSPPPRRTKLPLVLAALAALALGGGGFAAMRAGLILPPPAPPAPPPEAATVAPAPAPAGAFVAIDPITINLGGQGEARHLRFIAQLEVAPADTAEVGRLMPRIVDVLNTYLRALDLPELEDPAALTRLRAQMLRRIQIVVGPGRVQDLLIMEFVFY